MTTFRDPTTGPRPPGPFRLIYQEPRDPPPGLCPMMQARVFPRLEEAHRERRAMQADGARKPVQILDADRHVVWDAYGDD